MIWETESVVICDKTVTLKEIIIHDWNIYTRSLRKISMAEFLSLLSQPEKDSSFNDFIMP